MEHTFTVSELNSYANLVLSLDGNLKSISVSGEISGFKRHPSGHMYFILKDDASSVRAVMFKYNACRLAFLPKDGLAVKVSGHVGLFEKDGSFQLYADSMTVLGSGDLYKQFEELKNDLQGKGWFSDDIKKSIPFLPRCVGVVTSSSGAAIEDIKKVIGRRFPGMPIKLYSSAVQGYGAALDIARAINEADKSKEVDVLIVGRGGGSLEDLWAFNELPVAIAVHDCSIPIISAVGHEIDYSICDFVADVRAATPSAAAEIAVPELSSLNYSLASLNTRLSRCIYRSINDKKNQMNYIAYNSVLKNPHALLDESFQRLETEWAKACDTIKTAISDYSLRLKVSHAVLKSYSEESLMSKGVIFTTDEKGSRIFSISDLFLGETINLHFKDGSATAKVTDISEKH